ncbi:hypothetical protein EFT87_12720 [Schleiferilactobacillus harbinensis]|uniref:hypothetical protein n=1 Tax=Schleiferilactobacillus harbinensis TaxID=304207 RepID=UPI0021A6CBDA|nr:hypothetical protein [Schleiferilactobacillus harbinensis]MCT2909514.1 hypothetical protein [Schleiferilactobacillus harbinensis]
MTNKKEFSGPVIKLDSYRVVRIDFNRVLSDSKWASLVETVGKPNIEMNYSISEDFRHGSCTMTAHIVRASQKQYGDVSVVGFFTFRDDVTDLEDQKKYLAVNGGAMLYPYLRVTASMITALDNPDTTILASLNFIEQFKNLHDSK